MPVEQLQEQREHEFMMHVFSISAGMVGVCLTAIGILRLVVTQTKVQTLGDDLLAVDAVLFGICCFLSFGTFKARLKRLRQQLRLLGDVIFLVALVIMVCACCIIAYAIV